MPLEREGPRESTAMGSGTYGYHHDVVDDWRNERIQTMEALLLGDMEAAASYAARKAADMRSPDAPVVAALIDVARGQPRQATTTLQHRLEYQIIDSYHRGLLHWVRAGIQWKILNDPIFAAPELELAADQACSAWSPSIQAALEQCRSDAQRSRRRKPVIPPPCTTPRFGPWPDLPLDFPAPAYADLLARRLGLPAAAPVRAPRLTGRYVGEVSSSARGVVFEDEAGRCVPVPPVHRSDQAPSFQWGVFGDGSLHLARSLLFHAYGDPTVSQRLCHPFAREVMTRWPSDRSWHLDAAVVRRWIGQHGTELNDRWEPPIM